MYYLLGHLLMDTNLNINRKAIRGENTYILALDGDIDFKTNAVLLLVDLMKKNSNLGAACGRIHPIGTGLMVFITLSLSLILKSAQKKHQLTDTLFPGLVSKI